MRSKLAEEEDPTGRIGKHTMAFGRTRSCSCSSCLHRLLWFILAFGISLCMQLGLAEEGVLGLGVKGDVGPISASWCPDVFFNFGDSMSDTGNGVLVYAEFLHVTQPPYGESFFGWPTGRFNEGRVTLDFILMSFKRPLLRPSSRAFLTREPQGLNFAVGGASSAPIFDTYLSLYDEVGDFLKRKAMADGHSTMNEAVIGSALYIIDSGGNDLLYYFEQGSEYADLFARAGPDLIQATVAAVESLYRHGARKFVITNIPPQGCAPSSLTFMDIYGTDLDELGCFSAINAFNRAVNKLMLEAISSLRERYSDASIIHFDRFAANIEVLTNPAKYGFDPELTLVACCGAPDVGNYNFNRSHLCGGEGFTECKDKEKYVSWDGIHYTEAYNRLLAKFFLDGTFSDPPTNLTAVCNLTFENFGPDVTYEQVYGLQIVAPQRNSSSS